MPAVPPRNKKVRLRSGLGLLLCWPALACAADGDSQPPADAVVLDTVTIQDAAEKPYTVDESTSATKLGLSPRDTPQSVTVVTQQRLADQNLQSMRDVLDNVTGVYSYAFDSERVVFTSRGFIVDNTLYDGVPVATNTDTSSTDATLDTALYERIEVVRGATGLLTGAGSPSAAINLERKHADSSTFQGSAAFTAASWNDFRTTADISTPLNSSGSVRARVVGVYQNRDSYMDLYRNEKQVFYGVIDADLGSRTRLSAGYDYQQTLPQGNTWGSFPLFYSDGSATHWPRSVTSAADWSYWNKRTQTLFAQLDHQFGDGWTARTSVQRRATDGHSNLFYVYGFPDKDTGEGLVPYAYRSDDTGRQNSADAYLKGPFELLGRKHEIVMGAMGSWLHQDAYEYAAPDELAPVGNFNEWDGSYAEPAFATESTQVERNRVRQSAAYSALRLSLADPLKLILGARYSGWKNDRNSVYDDAPFKQSLTQLTPYAGLVYDISRDWSAFASYTEIFNPQNNQREDGSYLDPVKGNSTEIGIKGAHFGGRLNTALTVFDTRQDNVAVADFGKFVNDDPMRPAYTAVDGTRTRGFEVEASGEPLKNWNLSAGWSYYRMEDADGNDVKGYIPRTLVRAFTTYKLSGALQALTVGGGVNWQSKNYVNAENPTAEDNLARVTQKSYTLVSLMARYQFTPALSLQINGNNLLDKQYYVIDEYGNLYYGPPASAAATISYNF